MLFLTIPLLVHYFRNLCMSRNGHVQEWLRGRTDDVSKDRLFSPTISPNIEAFCGKMCGHITCISSDRRDNLTTHFATNRVNIGRYCERK